MSRVLSNTPARLEVDSLTVQFGGLLAVNNVSLQASPGMITGLIGPNGAGKTTIFNACTGLVDAKHGSVHLDGRRLDRYTPARRAEVGLGRTFQRMELFDTQTAFENVAMGPESRYAGHRWWSQLWSGPQERRDALIAAEEAMDRCAISHIANVTAGDLPTGQRRLVELARAIASQFRFLLLDEPSSGLDESETSDFGRILLDITDRDGTGILLVEHDMALVRQVCTYVYVLDFGQMVFDGSTDQMLASDVVREAYLGTTKASANA